MSELVVFKANELVISRYDLTEHETKLILFCVAKLNPTIAKPNEEQRTITFSCAEYAQIMDLSYENAWGRLNSATSELFKRSVELIIKNIVLGLLLSMICELLFVKIALP